MNHEETALLRMIYAHPEDHTPKLVYADWLDEHGRPKRAEFIRLQIQLQQTTGYAGWLRDQAEREATSARGDAEESHWLEMLSFAYDPILTPEETQLRRRIDELLEHNREEWEKDFARARAMDEESESSFRLYYSCGFPEAFEGSCRHLAASQRILRKHPLIRSFRLAADDIYDFQPSDEEDEIDISQIEAVLRRCDSFQMIDGPGPDKAAAVPLSKSLQRYTAQSNECGPNVPRDPSEFPQLKWYDVNNSDSSIHEPGDDEFMPLIHDLHSETIEYFSFSQNNVSSRGAIELAHSPHMRNLRTLRLDCEVGCVGVRAILSSEHLKNLRHLEIGDFPHWRPDHEITPEIAQEIVRLPRFGQLHLLEIHVGECSSFLWLAIAESPASQNLRVLTIHGYGDQTNAEAQKEALRAVVTSPHLRSLRWLSFETVLFSDSMVDVFLKECTLPNLHTISVIGDQISQEEKARLETRFRVRNRWPGEG